MSRISVKRHSKQDHKGTLRGECEGGRSDVRSERPRL